ncbi:MAG: DUF4386 domain-containing protein [Flavobacteriales bacterium]|nr:DUF4386 domain-containing protein [Flavobacteriales bacterium]
MNKLIQQHKIVAVITGLSIIVMAVVATLIMVSGRTSMNGDPEGAVDMLRSGQEKARAEAFGWIVVLILDIIASWGIYLIFKLKNQELASLSALFRLIYSAILGAAIGFLVYGLFLGQKGIENSVADLAGYFVFAFQEVWSFGLIIFGLHLVTLGWLTWDKSILAKILGTLLVIGGSGYVLIHSAHVLMADDSVFKMLAEPLFMAPMILGELGFALLLFVRGIKKGTTSRPEE